MRMDPHKYRLFGMDGSMYQRHVRFAIDLTFESKHAKHAVSCRQFSFSDLMNESLRLKAKLDEVRYGDHLQSVDLREILQLLDARHRAVVIHDFADHTGRVESGDASQINRCFGLAGANQHTTFSCTQGKYMARPDQVV